jgi:Secretory lipase
VDGANRPIVASGLVALPIKPNGRRAPVLSYQHGTIFKDAEAPSNAMKPEEPPLVFASLGYIVLAADYVGYGVSKGAPHPYLLSAPAAAAVNDLITAARLWRQQAGSPGPTANGQLFLAGYSEGGYATAAAHRELQQQGAANPHLQTLVMSFAGGGPQDVGLTLDRQLARVKDQNRLIGGLINPGFLRHLGNTLREEVRRQMLKLIIPDDADVSFQSTFLDFFLADDVGNINRHCNVLDWAPQLPHELFHGRDDRTVSFVSSQNAQAYAIAAGARPALVPLTECDANPSDHLPCVPRFFLHTVGRMASVARDVP